MFVNNYYVLVGKAPETYSSRRECLSVRLYFQVTFLHNTRELSAETCSASRTWNPLEKKMNKINFRNKTLFYSYSMIGSHSRLFLAIKLTAKINLPKADYFSTWQFNLYDKSDGNPSEIQGMTHR